MIRALSIYQPFPSTRAIHPGNLPNALPISTFTRRHSTTYPSLVQRGCSALKTFLDMSTENKASAQKADELREKLIEQGKKQLKFADHDSEKLGFIGSPPDTVEGLLAWRSLEAERIQKNLSTERRAKIEQAAKDGDPFYQAEWEKIQGYERSLVS